MKESQCLYQIIHRNAVVLLTLQILTAQLQIITALIPTLQILAEVMMNPTKTGSISRSTTGSSSTSSFEIRGETLAGIVQGLGGGISNILF